MEKTLCKCRCWSRMIVPVKLARRLFPLGKLMWMGWIRFISEKHLIWGQQDLIPWIKNPHREVFKGITYIKDTWNFMRSFSRWGLIFIGNRRIFIWLLKEMKQMLIILFWDNNLFVWISCCSRIRIRFGVFIMVARRKVMLEVTCIYCVVGIVVVCVKHDGSRFPTSSATPSVVIIVGK